MNFLLAILAFNFIVIIHETGHFIAARLANIKILEFSLFIGPKIFSVQKGETTYSLRLFPILAYVKMEGEEERSDSERAFNKKPLFARFAVIAAGPLSNLFVAILVLAVVFSITGYTTTSLVYVEEGSPAYNASLREGDKIIKYDGKRVYQPMDLVQFLYVYKGSPAKVEVIRDGKRFETMVEPLKMEKQEKYLFGFNVMQESGVLTNVVDAVLPGSPAEKAGLMPGDKVIMLNDTSIYKKEDIDRFMSTNKGNTVKMTVLRNGSELMLEITPYVQVIGEQYYLGIDFEFKKGTLPEVIKHSIIYAYSVVRSVAYSIIWLITGRASISQMTGPIGIVSTIGEVVEQGSTLGNKLLYL
ncbi:MAG: RIP metalloprotease RseP, partial [Clostridiaceae bacterium]|nr:RIP metalloprotease RseP [Clostridiaceae bacterium]